MVGKTITHYRVLEKLGEGGMGVVYKARDTDLDRLVALKFLLSSEDVPRLLREAKTAASLNHPNICSVYEVAPEHGFIAMELVEGQSLAARIGSRPLPVEEAVGLAVQICEGLKAAHDKGITHRDIKSANILVTPDGHVKILDFGLARVAGQAGLTREGAAAGTPGYMAPEQMRGEPADRRTDIWAVGAVLHEMLTGRLPMGQAETLPEGLGRIVRKALAAHPGERYQHVEDLVVDLVALRQGLSKGPQAFIAQPRRRQVLWLVGGGAVALAVAAGLKMGGIWRRVSALFTGPAQIRSIAVLPLENLSGDAEQEIFSVGMTDALITDLAKIRALRVTGRRSVMRYKNARKPLPEIARELGVEAVLDGSVLREGGRVRVTAQLIEASTDRHLWAESYERELSSILALQGEISRAVARGVRVQLRPEEETRLATRRQVNPATYEAYLRGMLYLNKSTPADTMKGIEYLQQAVEADPADPLAYAGLALGYVTVAHSAEAQADSLPRAKAAARTALKLDPSQAEAAAALGLVEGYHDWSWDDGFRNLDRALDTNPSLAIAYYHRSWFSAIFGRMKEAIADHRQAQQLDPFNPLHTAWLGELYRMERRYDEATAEVLKSIEMAPQFPPGHFILGLIRLDQGRHDEAIAAIKKAGEVAPNWRWALGPACAAAGRISEARKLLAELGQLTPAPFRAFWRVQINAALGNMDEAFRWLNYEPHHIWLAAFRVSPWPGMEAVRKDPRFPAQLRRMNLPPISQASSRV